MSKKSKIALIVSACLCIAGIVFFGAGWLLGGVQYLKDADVSRMDAYAQRSDRLYTQEKTEIDAIEGFDIELDYADLYINSSNDDKFYIEYALNVSADKDPIKREITDGILSLTDEYKSEVIISLPDIGLLFGAEPVVYKNEVILYVPEGTEFTDSKLVLDDGDFMVEAAGFAINGAEVSMDYGNMHISEAEINDGDIFIDDGDCDFEEVQMESVKLAMNYGNLSWKEGNADACTFELDDGNVDFDRVRFAGEGSIVDDYGNVTLKMMAEDLMHLDLDLATDYGEIYTPEELAGNSFVKDDVASFVRKTGDAQGSMKIYADSGNITVLLLDEAL